MDAGARSADGHGGGNPMIRPTSMRYWLALALMIFLCTGSAWAEICKGSKVKKADLLVFDQGVELTQPERDQAIQTHLPYGTPPCPKFRVHREYIVCYDVTRRVPQWAAYTLTTADLGPRARLDAFRTDPRVMD